MEWPVIVLIAMLGFADLNWGSEAPTQFCIGAGGVTIYINTGLDAESEGPKIDPPSLILPADAQPAQLSKRIYLSPRVRIRQS